MAYKKYDEVELKRIRKGCKTRSDLYKKMKKAVKDKKSCCFGRTVESVRKAFERRGHFEGLKMDTKGILAQWSAKKKRNFKKSP